MSSSLYEVGRAGAFVAAQKRRQRMRSALYAGVAALLAVAAAGLFAGVSYADFPAPRGPAVVAGITAVAGCLYAWTGSVRALRQARRSAVGARSERQVRVAVRRSGSIAAAYGLLLGGRGGDCDAVVVTRARGIAAVEVKTGHGRVTVANETMRAGRRVLAKSPTRQAANQARLLSRRLGRAAVLPVVCVPGMTNRPFATADGVWVCSAAHLADVLDRAETVFGSTAEARTAIERLWSVSRDARTSRHVRMPENR